MTEPNDALRRLVQQWREEAVKWGNRAIHDTYDRGFATGIQRCANKLAAELDRGDAVLAAPQPQDLGLEIDRLRFAVMVFDERNAGLTVRTNVPHVVELVEAARALAQARDDQVAGKAVLAAPQEEERLLRDAVLKYLSYLNGDMPLNDEFRTLKARVITAACSYVVPNQPNPIAAGQL